MGYDKEKVKPVTVYVPKEILPAIKAFGKVNFRTESASKTIASILEDWHKAQEADRPMPHRPGRGTGAKAG